MKIPAILLLALTTGCSGIDLERDRDFLEWVCKDHGGVHSIHGGAVDDLTCNNGYHQSLTRTNREWLEGKYFEEV